MIQVQDWRFSPPEDIEQLLAHERDAWRRDLDWDVREAWQAIEPARRAGTLPGFVATDERGQTTGWTSFLLHHDNVQVLAFVAPAPETASALVDAIVASPDAATADAVLFCVRSASDSLPGALAVRGFRVEPYRYLSVELKPRTPVADGLRRWAGDGARLARLFARGYDGDSTTRAFAPRGTASEWTEYVATLLTTTGCGRFVGGVSVVAPSTRGNELAGAVIVTELAPRIAHVAQIAVDPGERGRGLGRQLLSGSMSAAAASGYTRMTLLVAASNQPALALYEGAGFQDRATFIVARADRSAGGHELAAVAGELGFTR